MTAIQDIPLTTITGEKSSLADHAGSVLLLVNVTVAMLVGWVAVAVRVLVAVGESPMVTVAVTLGDNDGVGVNDGVRVTVNVGVGGSTETTVMAPSSLLDGSSAVPASWTTTLKESSG